MNSVSKFFSFKNLLWAVYIGVLVVIAPHTQWMFSQFEPSEMHGLAWVAAIVFEAAIFAVTHLLVRHIEKRRASTFNFEKARMWPVFQWWPMFRYRYINAYTVLLFIAVFISGWANLAHAVQFGQPLTIVSTWNIPSSFFSVAFGGVLPLVNLLFAAVIAQVDDSESTTDPALEQAKAEKREAEKRAKEAEKARAEFERLLGESEQRYRAIGDVVRYLFEQRDPLHDRILYVRKTFPQLSQNGISQILGCSVSTVNDAVKSMEVVEA